MEYVHNRNKGMIRNTIILIFCFYSLSAHSQQQSPQDTVFRISKGSYLQMMDFKHFITRDTIINIPSSLVKRNIHADDMTVMFYDSLKVKASKTIFTKALFALVIVKPDTGSQKRITNRSDERFKPFKGARIRKIIIQRLNAFGANVSNPGLYQPKGLEKLLNETHVNTNENIIRKNLIFNEGDSISPLKLADNERLLRQLPYIDDATIVIVPVSSEEADIIVVTKDVYSIGADFTLKSKTKGSFWLFDKNIFGSGHEFRVEIPYSGSSKDSPGVGLTYSINNIKKSFVNLDLIYYNGLGKKSYTVTFYRNLVTSETKYAGGILVRQMFTSADLDTLPVPEPLQYNYQDLWLMRSFLVDRNSVTRIIGGLRFINDNIYERPQINPNSYYALQRKELLLGSVTFSRQKFYKSNLIYSYGKAEDIPYGGLFRITGGIERNEFKNRAYLSGDAAVGGSLPELGYFQISAGLGSFLRDGTAEQGMLISKLAYVSNLIFLGTYKIRNFVNMDYTRGFNRYSDEYLKMTREKGFTGFRNDSIKVGQRVRVNLESVLFSPINYYGFRFAFFGFADMAFLKGINHFTSRGVFLTGLGIGIRIRNDNLVFSTFQVRLGFFPNAPDYSLTNNLWISGEQQLRAPTFDPGTPALLPYK